MNITNKLIDILSLQAIAVKVKSVYKNIQKVFDAGYESGYEEGVKTDPQWNAYCLRTGEHFDLPEGMTEIWNSMFSAQENLKTVNIPETIASIGSRAFWGCGNLQVNQLPNSVTYIQNEAYAYCWGNKAVVFSPEIDAIEERAFHDNQSLTEVTFVCTGAGRNVPTSIADDTFSGCVKLEKINVFWSEGEVAGEFDADGNRINWGAPNATVVHNFWDTARTSEVFTFPPGFIKIPDYLFYDTTKTSAKEIYLGDECEEIGEAAFYRAANLETVHLPDGLKKIGQWGFRYCSALNCSELPDSVEEIANRAFHGSSISLSKLPTNIKELGIRCFQGCSGNKFTEIPAGIVRISAEAFMNNTGLTKLIFLSTPEVDKVAKGIASDAFAGCTNLVEIGVPWSEGEVSGAPWGAENATIIYDWEG